MTNYVDEVFGEGGLLSGHLPDYLPRPQQVELARAVDRAIERGRCLVAECPAGVGKSFGYGVPAIRRAVEDGLTVVIATANIALQEQLAGKDLPFLAGALPWDFSYALVKGRGNYLCVNRLERERMDGTLELAEHPADVEPLRRILEWAKETKAGDVSELPFIPPPRVWQRLSSSGEECKGRDCKDRSACHAERARSAAENADVVVCNYHMLLAHVAVREASGEDRVLPKHDVVICDEAHKMADIARDFAGFKVTGWSFRRAAALAGKLGDKALRDAATSAGDALMDRLLELRRSKQYKARLRSPDPVRWDDAAAELRLLVDLYQAEARRAVDPDWRMELRVAANRATLLASRIHAAMRPGEGDGMVYFVEEDSKGQASLCSRAVDVADHLREGLFEPLGSAVLTSATLAVGGSLDHLVSELGVPDPGRLIVGTPFDFASQAMLVLPEKLPDPTAREFADEVARLVDEVVELADGRTLALFTSYRNLRAAADRLGGKRWRVLVQGTAPRTALAEEFRRDVGSVLLGTDSFWAGVDVPGEALSCVVIDRLPFPTPDDPVLDAVKERNRRGWFQEYSVPRAVTAFRQGFGRLIRSVGDRGVVVALDRRLVDKPYGRTFLASLPNVRLSRSLSSVREFLGPGG